MFKQPENAWEITECDKATCLIDGEQYFPLLRQAIINAKRAVFIVGWDVDSRFELIKHDADDGMPTTLKELVDTCAKKTPGLNIYILAWDYSPMLALSREWLLDYKLGLSTHERVHFSMHSTSAVSASHHQKFVVIDDQLAFIGGLDITRGRWDSQAHDPKDRRRCDSDDQVIPRPYHDIQMMVSGPCAKALGKLARQRWLQSTGDKIEMIESSGGYWPKNTEAEFYNCDIAISLTNSAQEPNGEIRQVEQLYLDMIDEAQNFIYIENQYLTADKIGDRLEASLQREHGPEIVIISGYSTVGWLSQYTMDVLRCRMVDRLRNADKYQRLRVYYPHIPDTDKDNAINVHAKLMIVDDKLLRVGSANLNNRSMGLDSECDLTLAAESEHNRKSITSVRNRLLAEHLDVTTQDVMHAWKTSGSLIKTIANLQGQARTLKRLDISLDPDINNNLPHKAIIDPEIPVDSNIMRDIMVPAKSRKPAANRIVLGALALLAVLGLTALWRWTPLAELADIDTIKAGIKTFREGVYAPFVAIGVVAVGGLIGIPVTLLILAVMLVFGALVGTGYSLVGALISTYLAFLIGRHLGSDLLNRIAGKKLEQIRKQVKRKGIWTIAILRMVPIAPFIVINLVAGASRIPLRDFLFGTFVGMLPGTIILALVSDGVIRATEAPNISHLLIIIAVLGSLALLTVMMRKWLINVGTSKS